MSSIPENKKLDAYVEMGLLSSRAHQKLPLTIYNYTQFTVMERLWNNITLACRGLVVDDNGRCVIRCMRKFFNEGEAHYNFEYPKDSGHNFRLFDKLDGSLIQVVNDEEYGLIVTSKGSFESDQARWAREIIERKYHADFFERGVSYSFELIHPENRIVLDYGVEEDIFLVAAIKTESGKELDIRTKRFDDLWPKAKQIHDLEEHMDKLVEGVVLWHESGWRGKIKTGEYVRLHRIVTEFTEKRVWEALSQGDSLEFENMPEEFETWLETTVAQLKFRFADILTKAQLEFAATQEFSDKELGLSDIDKKIKGLVFMLRKGKPIEPTIWKMIKP